MRSHGNARARPACLTGWKQVGGYVAVYVLVPVEQWINKIVVVSVVSLKKTGRCAARRLSEEKKRGREKHLEVKTCTKTFTLAGFANISHCQPRLWR